MICSNILDSIGNTPVIRLNRMAGSGDAEVLVKFEGLNVGGSVKTRTAYNMILEAEKLGLLKPDSIICEPTSGNQGIGLALIAAVRGYKAVVIMPDSVSGERRKLIEQYGAEVILRHDDGDIGKVIEDCLQTALRMAKENPKIFVPQQFENPANPAVHREHTGREIIEQLNGLPLHGFCSGIGTGGTISGIGAVLREKYPDIEIWALEPENAAILLGGKIGTHVQMGIGDGLVPPNLNTEIYSKVDIVSDRDALQTAKDLARLEGLMCGISGGSNVCTALRMAKKLGKGKRVITLLPDTAERYFSTPLF
ncbi:MAG: pyridoxal-phosphate dependent enzyme [Treponema sp.]|nr:pyridoxal-phosphate dependent enzyme [Treponema sp.]